MEEVKDGLDQCKYYLLILLDLGLKPYSIIVNDKIAEDIKFSDTVKRTVYDLVQSSLDKADGSSLLYSKEHAEVLEQGLKREVESMSIKLDSEIMSFVNS